MRNVQCGPIHISREINPVTEYGGVIGYSEDGDQILRRWDGFAISASDEGYQYVACFETEAEAAIELEIALANPDSIIDSWNSRPIYGGCAHDEASLMDDEEREHRMLARL